jgi:tetratricopeptide (TPR) repeat protein
MRRYMATCALMTLLFLAGTPKAGAQSAILNLPRVSQHARTTQRIGLTDITVDYHRPLVGGRKIFGGLQAYGKVWRAGANENTTFEVSDPVTIEGQPLAKGIYGLHMIPGEASWVVIFSRNATSWGSFTYDQSEDLLRLTVQPQNIENQEVLTYEFDDPKLDSVVFTMRWEKVAVPLHVKVNTPEIVDKSLARQLRGRAQFEWQPWMEASNYLINNHLSAEVALKYADRSIENEDRFENEITRAHALTLLDRHSEAQAAHDKAIALGTQSQVHDFGRGLQAQGHQQEAIELFRDNVKKDPNSWIGHNEAARVAVAKGDFDTAAREMKLAGDRAPESLKPQIADLVRRLENKEDINK